MIYQKKNRGHRTRTRSPDPGKAIAMIGPIAPGLMMHDVACEFTGEANVFQQERRNLSLDNSIWDYFSIT